MPRPVGGSRYAKGIKTALVLPVIGKTNAIRNKATMIFRLMDQSPISYPQLSIISLRSFSKEMMFQTSTRTRFGLRSNIVQIHRKDPIPWFSLRNHAQALSLRSSLLPGASLMASSRTAAQRAAISISAFLTTIQNADMKIPMKQPMQSAVISPD